MRHFPIGLAVTTSTAWCIMAKSDGARFDAPSPTEATDVHTAPDRPARDPGGCRRRDPRARDVLPGRRNRSADPRRARDPAAALCDARGHDHDRLDPADQRPDGLAHDVRGARRAWFLVVAAFRPDRDRSGPDPPAAAGGRRDIAHPAADRVLYDRGRGLDHVRAGAPQGAVGALGMDAG